MADWRLKPRAQRCAGCGAPFAPGGMGHSLLTPDADGGFARRDLCPACFAALPAQEKATASAAWAFTLPASARRCEEPTAEQRVSPEAVLRALAERGAPGDRAAIYVLALLLERGKRLVERQVATDAAGRRVHLYECRGTGEAFAVAEPDLAAVDLPAVQRQVAELLEHGLRPRAAVLRRRRPSRPIYRVKRNRR